MRTLRLVSTVVIVGLGVLVTACGGSDAESSNAAPAAGEFTARSVEFGLPRRSDIGTKDAYVTFTSRSDGKTAAAVDFYVPRTPKTRGDVYSVDVHKGACSSLGETTVSLGDLSAGVTVVVLDGSYDDTVAPIEQGDSSIVIMKPDGKTVAWCGPTS